MSYIFEEDSNLSLDSTRKFCMVLVGFLKGSSYEDYMFAFDQMRNGLCPFKEKCTRFLGILPKHKSRFYETPTLTILAQPHAHRIIRIICSVSQLSLDL